MEQLEICGLKSSGTFEASFKRRIQSLLEFSPSDASAFVNLKKVKEGYEGILNIAFSQGHFLAKSINADLNDLVKNLSEQIHNQIIEWRGHRFLAE